MDTLKQQLTAIQEGGAVGGPDTTTYGGDSQSSNYYCNYCFDNPKSARRQKLINDLQRTANNAEKNLRYSIKTQSFFFFCIFYLLTINYYNYFCCI